MDIAVTHPPRSPRVALAGFVHESNSFAPTPADVAAFEHGGGYLPVSRGAQILERAPGLNWQISGGVEYGLAQGWDMVPLVYAAASPSAPVTAQAYHLFAEEIIASVARAHDQRPLDGVFLDLHGAMLAEGENDGEGALIARLRALLGPNVPIAAALDLHGNITPMMVENADLLVGFRTYPHVDMAETGRRCAAGLGRLMQGERLHKAFRQLDFLIPIAWQSTLMQPGQRLYALAEQVGAELFMGFPAADFADCGPSVIAYAETADAAHAACDRVADAVSKAEPEFRGEALSPADAVRRAQAMARDADRPIIIADSQDNPGAGGDSDTTGMLRALIALDAQNAAIGLIVDPPAAAMCHQAGAGASIRLALGGRSGISGDSPLTDQFEIEALSDGRLTATGPFYGGTMMELGPSACLRKGGVRIVLASRKTQMADREMFRFVHINPEDCAILVVKSSVHFRADFQPIAAEILTAAAPGPMPVSPADLPFTALRPGIRLEPMGIPFTPGNGTKTASSKQRSLA
ncbi:MAG: M81 family metallopeptidase [Paracoccus sp. (in: a-proteobacteria)]|uniref:M81 family metallopeptidase n=1 Tax=Paracoccus sp. TaxID=267 RepID=UPI0026E09242|nr:M81 family metallopeptidase [Paracoccus sp. (in: a-proteobacteria)]MDO5613903.1 M81 family metallopeptidase [Paracoccus sp. (in: a-proteobacteria)]